MVRFKLTPYIIRVKRRQTDKSLPLDNIDGYGTDFMKILQGYFNNIQQTQVLDKAQKTISVSKIEISQRSIYGILKSGEYGIEADFENVETGDVIPRARKPYHSETLPFFFLFHIPKGKERGFSILQTFKVQGIKTVLERTLNEYLGNMGLIVQFNRLISQKLLEELENSRLVELRFIRYDVPRDTADKVHDGSPEEIIEERVYRAKRKRNINLSAHLKEILSNRETSYYEILDEKYNEVKALIEKDGSKITLTFGENNKFREFLPLNDKNMPFDGAFPAYNYLLDKAKSYLDHLKEELGEG